MATNKIVNGKFTWGDAVSVCSGAPKKFQPRKIGSICGIREIETEKVSKKFSEPVGTYLYLVEFQNGDAIEIPEKYLEPSD